MSLTGWMLKIASGTHLALWKQGTNKNEFLNWLANNADDPDSWAYAPRWSTWNRLFGSIERGAHIKVGEEFLREEVYEPQYNNAESSTIYYIIGGMILFGVLK